MIGMIGKLRQFARSYFTDNGKLHGVSVTNREVSLRWKGGGTNIAFDFMNICRYIGSKQRRSSA